MLLILHRLRDWNRRCMEQTISYTRRRWYRALLLCRVVSAFQAAGQKHYWRHPGEGGKSHDLSVPVLAGNLKFEDPLGREKTQVQVLTMPDPGDSPFGCFALTATSTDVSQPNGKSSRGKILVEKKPRQRRCFSKQEKERINQVRKTGACQSCRRKRRKVRSRSSTSSASNLY